MPHSIRRSIALALALALGTLASHPDAAGAQERWHKVVTPHFTYFSAAAPEDVAQSARELEAMAAVLGQIGLGAPVGCRPRTVLIGFPDRRTFDPHRPLVDGHPVKVEGYCMHIPFGRWIGYLESEERGRLIARHEFAHTVVSDVFWRVPPCLNEGIAEFLSTFEVKEDEAAFGHPLDWHRYVVQSSELLDLDGLFAVRPEDMNARSPEAQQVFYAESWALVHYLARDGFAALVGFVQAIANGAEPRAAFARAFPAEDWVSTPARLKSYVDVDVLRYHRIPMAKLAISPGSAVVVGDAAPGEVMAHVGLWRLYADVDSSGTEACFDQALREAPALGLALVGRGMSAFRGRRFDEAIEDFRRGTSGTPDAQTLFIAGCGLLQTAEESGRAGRGGPTEEAYAFLKRSVALDSSDATALAWYARAGAELGDYPPEVIRALERASAALPSDPVLAADLASILARTGEVRRSTAARVGLTRVTPGTDPGNAAAVASAHDSLLTAAYDLGVAAANQERYEEAAGLFRRVATAAAGTELGDSASAMIGHLRGRAEFARGLKATREGDTVAALRWFDKAVELAGDEELRGRAAEYAARLRAMRQR